MGYYGQGDYYSQGGIWDVVKGIGRTALGFATGGPAGAVSSIATSVGRPAQPLQMPSGFTIPKLSPTGGSSGGRSVSVDPVTGEIRRRRRRINPANGKALNRANRRVDAFVRMAKRSLKHTNYKLVSKSAGKGRRRPQVLVETGPGSINAR